VNDAPIVTSGGPASTDEGTPVSAFVSFTDVESTDTHTCSINWGDGTPVAVGTVTEPSGSTAGTCSGSHTYVDDNPTNTASDPYNATFTVTDSASTTGGTPTLAGSAIDVITVRNVPPVVTINSPASGATYPIGTTVLFAGSFTDVGKNDTHSAVWTADGADFPGTVTEVAGSGTGTVTGSHQFNTPGVYDIVLHVTDDDSGTGSASTVGGPNGLPARIIIYDPNAGFVTGGGYITQALGMIPAGASVGAKANYGFNAKYKGSSAPTGEVEFQLKPANINFHATSLDWLLVNTTSSPARAQFQGSGTNNGGGSYCFLLTVTDGGQTDTFRIKIWTKVDPTCGTTPSSYLYDNEPGVADNINPITPAAGGNIVVHK
jgi:hypothetical protein